MFYNYRPGRADKWCWQGVRPSGRQKGIVLAAAKMENIKLHSTDDCNLTKPLQGYLTMHIKQGDCFLESKTMTTSFWLRYFWRDCFISVRPEFQWFENWVYICFCFICNFYFWGLSKGTTSSILEIRGRQINIEKGEKYGWTPQLEEVLLVVLSAHKRHWCAMNQTPSKFTRGPKMPSQKESTYLPPQLPRDRKEK